MTKALNLTYFRDALETGDPFTMRRALAHMIAWHEIYDTAEHRVEIAYADPAKFDGLALTTELYASGIENDPGVIVYERKVTQWVPRKQKKYWHGPEQVISGCILPES